MSNVRNFVMDLGNSKSSIGIDVFLLAILLALHVTKKRNTSLIVFFLLVAHVLMTTNDVPGIPKVDVPVTDAEVSDADAEVSDVPVTEDDALVDQDESLGASKTDVNNEVPGVNKVNKVNSVKNSEFDRQFETPTQSGQMAKARSNFFSDIFVNK